MTAEHCSFCGQTRGSVRFLLHGPSVAICGDCIALAVRQMVEGKGIDADTFGDAPVLEVSVFQAYGAPASLPGGEFVEPALEGDGSEAARGRVK